MSFNPEWKPSTASPYQLLAAELHREMAAGHKLFGEEVHAVAAHTLTHKDFLFTSSNPAKPIACVHLTWASESDPTWPMTNVYKTLADWQSEMQLEHEKNKHLYPKYERMVKRHGKW